MEDSSPSSTALAISQPKHTFSIFQEPPQSSSCESLSISYYSTVHQVRRSFLENFDHFSYQHSLQIMKDENTFGKKVLSSTRNELQAILHEPAAALSTSQTGKSGC
jgi:hypothetical protein